MSYNYLQSNRTNIPIVYQNNQIYSNNNNHNTIINNSNLNNIKNINSNNNSNNIINKNSKVQQNKLKAIQRNKNIASILTIVISFSQRIQKLKQKISGYSAQAFSPVQFYNILDLTNKGYVDIYDVLKFVNNQKIKQVHLILLFKKLNGDCYKDSTKLSYFGYLNIIKPYFNQQLAKDILIRDTLIIKQRKPRNNSPQNRIGILQTTQQSVLVLFQQLIFLHCVCTSMHQQSKQLLIEEYMLNIHQIKQIFGFSSLLQNNNIQNNKINQPNKLNKSPLKILYDFIQHYSQYAVDFNQMKYLLSYLNTHQFNLSNDKYISILFLPLNCKNDLLKEIQKRKTQIQFNNLNQNSLNLYLTKNQLVNKGNKLPIKQYLNEKQIHNYLLSQNYIQMTNTYNLNKPNFLQFVHPESIQRPKAKQNNQKILQPTINSEHPHILVNYSNKNLSPSQQKLIYSKMGRDQIQNILIANNSSIPQQKILKYIPKQNSIYKSNKNQNQRSDSVISNNKMSHLKNQFYQGQQRKIKYINQSISMQTPFLQQFMKQNNSIKRNIQRKYNNDKRSRFSPIEQNSQIIESSNLSGSAFQVVDYGYGYHNNNNNYSANNNKKKAQQSYLISSNKRNNNYNDNSRYSNKNNLQNRYNMIMSNYNKIENNNEQQSSNNNYGYQNQYQNKKPFYNKKHQIHDQLLKKSSSRHNKQKSGRYNSNNILDNIRHNYILDNVGMSQSNMVNQSNIIKNNININKNKINIDIDNYYINNNLSSSGTNILDGFMKR